MYNYCTSIHQPATRTAPVKTRTRKGTSPGSTGTGPVCHPLCLGGAQFVGIELYSKLRLFLENHLKEIKPVRTVHVCTCSGSCRVVGQRRFVGGARADVLHRLLGRVPVLQ